MDPLSSRWAALEEDRRAHAPALHDPTTMTPACGGLRVRREYASRDAINFRAWDNFHATPPTQVSSTDLKEAGRPVYMDMNPINCRTYNAAQFRNQVEYTPKPVTQADTFSSDLYTQRLDAGGDDARNMIRELRSAVVEDNRDRQVDADRMLAQRQFFDRWMPAKTASDAASLNAYELLRPKAHDAL
jgi:hypothetical protein